MSTTNWGYGLTLLAGLLLLRVNLRATPKRTRIIQPSGERVLIIGASSGVGRATAIAYSKRGARVAIVARRESLLEELKQECIQVLVTSGFADNANRVLAVVADFANEEDMAKVRDTIQQGASKVLPVYTARSNGAQLGTGSTRWSSQPEFHRCSQL
jgi:NAD(P)-dependent dehydrogenase (short-subunit alcohol dehydrogenase family)